MSIAEASLYGDLVKFLRDRWAEQAAEFNESAFAEEQARINEIIRVWFFAPQNGLYGLCPREVIRNEEMGRPNVIPLDHPHEPGEQECELCEMMRDETLGGSGWHFGLAPDMTLLDDFDPEGYDLKWTTPRAPVVELPEARTWLKENLNDHAFAGNRFASTQEALGFVNYLYELGATNIRIENIYDEPYRIADYGGPYADTLLVSLPEDAEESAAIYQVFEHELRELQGLDLTMYEGVSELTFWWD